MSIKPYLLFLFVFLFASKSYGQAPGSEYYIMANGNLYLPIKDAGKGMYPILWYDKATVTKLLIGGFGIGLSAFKPVKSNVDLKGQANISKHAYWEKPLYLLDEGSNAAGTFQAGAADYALGITATAHYFFMERMSIGTGLGAQLLLLSLSRTPQVNGKIPIVINRHYKPFVPTLPVELAYKSGKLLFNVRYEHGLINRLKNDLKAYKKENFGLLSFEIGFRKLDLR